MDRLSDIEHEIDWCDTFECDGPASEDPDEPGTCDECGQPLVRVKVVHADQLRGAVDPAEIVAWLRGRTGYGGGFSSADDVADAIERRFITERGQT